MLVVFATNLDPARLVDEAFLRRIQTKIKVDFMKPDQFREVFMRLCLKHNLGYEQTLADSLIRMIELEYKEPLRACYPRDILQQILWAAQYRQEKPRLDLRALEQACNNYFLAL
jgi:hypothetical protein